MILRQKAGNDVDLFRVERKMKNLQKKHEAKLKKAYENEKRKEETDIFAFLNRRLHPVNDVPSTEKEETLKCKTTRNLNVTHLKLSEEIKKIEKEVQSLNQSLARHKPLSHNHNIIKGK